MTTEINNDFLQIDSKDLTWEWAQSWHSKIPRVYPSFMMGMLNPSYDEEKKEDQHFYSLMMGMLNHSYDEEKKEDQHFYNIAIIGNTGVGKSSLLNYLYPAAKAETGNGKPITKNGFHKHKFEMKGTQVCVYDSWGLEASKEAQWHHELDQELSKRGIAQSASDWFHSIFYCISASESRIQSSDIKIINKIIENKYPINIILTKADGCSEEQRRKLTNAIHETFPNIKVIPVCSEAKSTRAGDTFQFGKEEVEAQALEDFFDAMIMRGPEKIKFLMGDKLLSWVSDHIKNANNCAEGIIFSTFSVLDKNRCLADANKALKRLIEDMNESTKIALEEMYSVYQSNSRFINEDLISKSNRVFWDIDSYEGSAGTEYKRDARDLYFEHGGGLPSGLDQTAWVLASTVDAISSITDAAAEAIANIFTSGGDERKSNLYAVENYIRETFDRLQLSILRKAIEVKDNLESLKKNNSDIDSGVRVDDDWSNVGSIIMPAEVHAEATDDLTKGGEIHITLPAEKLRVITLRDPNLPEDAAGGSYKIIANHIVVLNRALLKDEVIDLDTKERLIREAIHMSKGSAYTQACYRVGSLTFDFDLTDISHAMIVQCHNGLGYMSFLQTKAKDKVTKGHKTITIWEDWWREIDAS